MNKIRQLVLAIAAASVLATGPSVAARTPVRTESGLGLVGDAELAIAARTALLQRVGEASLRVGVIVLERQLQLSGIVDDEDTRDAVLRVVESVPGIIYVENQLRVGQLPEPEPTDEQAARDRRQEVSNALLEARVKALLLRELGIRSLRLAIGAREGVVNLAGAIPTVEERQQAVSAALRVPGVQSVADEIRVDRSLRKTLVAN